MIESEFRRAVVRAEDRLDVAHNEHVLPLFEWVHRLALGHLDRALLQFAVLGHLRNGRLVEVQLEDLRLLCGRELMVLIDVW